MKVETVTEEHYEKIKELVIDVFSKTAHGYGGEAELVEKVRLLPDYFSEFELVAVIDDKIAGHGLLSPVTIGVTEGLVLAPLTVASDYQKSGIGTAILTELEKRALERKMTYISILGHPEYYQRFGYVEAAEFNIKCPFDVPSEAFMIKPLFAGALENVEGTLKYSAAFE